MEVINRLSGQTVELCYGCHKCTSGCPVAAEMDYGPDRLLRMVQLGEKQRLLESRDIWLCTACETCGTRCPNEINTARVIDALRVIAIASNTRVAEPHAASFHRLFLSVIHHLGRTHEATLLAAYKLRTLDLLSDLDSGARLFIKGKIPLIPHTIQGRRELRRLFQAAEKAQRASLVEPVEGPDRESSTTS